MMALLLHCADISNAVKPFAIAEKCALPCLFFQLLPPVVLWRICSEMDLPHPTPSCKSLQAAVCLCQSDYQFRTTLDTVFVSSFAGAQ